MTTSITITEALAEIPTIEKRIAKKQEFIQNYLYRQEAVRDPNESDGGSVALIAQARQSIEDLSNRLISIRTQIQVANWNNSITIDGQTRTIVEWLTWRREVAPKRQEFLRTMSESIQSMRRKAQQQGLSVVDQATNAVTLNYLVNVNEKALSDDIEQMETTLGTLDGQLSLKNATITIDLAD